LERKKGRIFLFLFLPSFFISRLAIAKVGEKKTHRCVSKLGTILYLFLAALYGRPATAIFLFPFFLFLMDEQVTRST
jgi:hypothetical protein